MRSGKRGGHYRRAPIGLAGIFLVFDGDERLECVGHAIIELRGEARYVAKVAIDKTIEFCSADIKAIIESAHRRAAA